MKNQSRLQVPRRLFPPLLLCLALAVSVGLLGAEAWGVVDTRRGAQAVAEKTLSNLAKSAAWQAAESFLMADTVLAKGVDKLEASGTQPAVLKDLSDFLAEEVRRSSSIHGVSVYDKNGYALASSEDEMPQAWSNQDRLYFQHHKQSLGDGAFLGPPIHSRSAGIWIVTLSRRLKDSHGQFAGVILASIEAQYFAEFYAHFALSHQGAIALVNENGMVYARSPDNKDTVGRLLSTSKILPTGIRPCDGVRAYKSLLDNVVRISSFRCVKGFPLIVIAAESRGEVFAAWRKSVWMHGALTIIAVLLLVLLGMLLARQLRLRELAEIRAVELARIDSLTGLANRRAFEDALERQWDLAAREGASIGLLLIDVDDFKSFNDTYGHQAGDTCLVRVADAVSRSGRPHLDYPARYGGEEMALILPGIKGEGLVDIAENLRLAVLDLAIRHVESRTGRFLSVSIGASVAYPDSAQDAETRHELVRAADNALYDAKAAGRNRVAIAQSALLI